MTTTASVHPIRPEPFGPIAAGLIARNTDGIRTGDADRLLAAVRAADGSWSAGYLIGFVAGISADTDLTDLVTEAKRHWMAGAFDAPTATARWGMLRGDKGRAAYLRACGILLGWKDGTDDLPDADECTMCDGRVLSNTEGVKCEHGVFCNEDCQWTVCGGRCLRDPS